MTGRPAHPKEEPTRIPYADDDMGVTVSDWFDCADAFRLGRIGGHLADARSRASAAAGEPWGDTGRRPRPACRPSTASPRPPAGYPAAGPTPRLSSWFRTPAVRSTASPVAIPGELAGAGNGPGRGTCRPASQQRCWRLRRPSAARSHRVADRGG